MIDLSVCLRTLLLISNKIIVQVQKRYDLNVLHEYLLKEKRAKSVPSLSQGLYERAVAVHCTDAGLWEDYLLFQVSYEKANWIVSNRFL